MAIAQSSGVPLPPWTETPGVNGQVISTKLTMEEATHHRRQLLKALLLQNNAER